MATLAAGLALLTACPGEAGDTDPPEQPTDRYCGQRTYERRMDLAGDGYAPVQRVDDSACWRYREDGDTVHVFHRIPETDGPIEGDGYCRMTGTKTSAFYAELTGGECAWLNSTTQFRFEVTSGEVEVPGDGSIAIVAAGLAMDLLGGERVVYSEEAYFVFSGTDTTLGDPESFPGDETGVIALPTCERDGCWEGTLAGSVVGAPECDALLDNFGPDHVQRFEIADGGTVVSHDGLSRPGFRDLSSCATLSTEGAFPNNQWRYRFEPGGVGVDARLRQYARVAGAAGTVDCEVTWEGQWAACP